MMRYEWSEGRSRSIPAQVVGEELELIEERFGKITPDTFVKAAQEKSSPLHPLLDWNNTTAAHSHRLHQARMVINSVNVVVHEADPVRVQAFVSVKEGVERRYVAHVNVVSDDEMYGRVVAELRAVINAYRRKLSGFERFRELVSMLEDAA